MNEFEGFEKEEIVRITDNQEGDIVNFLKHIRATAGLKTGDFQDEEQVFLDTMKLFLRERYGFKFRRNVWQDVSALHSFSRRGIRVSLREEYSASEEVYFYLHALAHIRLSHIQAKHLQMWVEFKDISKSKQMRQEYEADQWIIGVINRVDTNSPIIKTSFVESSSEEAREQAMNAVRFLVERPSTPS